MAIHALVCMHLENAMVPIACSSPCVDPVWVHLQCVMTGFAAAGMLDVKGHVHGRNVVADMPD